MNRGRVASDHRARGQLLARGLLLAAILGHGSGACRDAPASTDRSTALYFVDATAASSVDFVHQAGYTAERWAPEIMGGGVAIVDVNRDGAPDIVLINSGALGVSERPSGAETRLYLNDGRGNFRAADAEWPLPSSGYGMGVAAGDFDGDGWTDLFLTSYEGGDRLLRNTGAGFEDVTEAAGISDDGQWSTSAAFLDIDGDGALDIWVVRYIDYDTTTAVPCYDTGVHVYCTPKISDGVADRLWRNQGDGTFIDVSAEAGLHAVPPGKGLALVTGDIDDDGDVDVYVANDLTRNHLWLNDGRGRFEEIGQLAGVAYSSTGIEEAGMGADMSDFDGDGRQDLVVPNFQGQTTSLYLQRSPLLFMEVSDARGIGMIARARLGFGIEAFDADNDGDEDLIVANGHLYDNVSELVSDVAFEQPNTLYENRDGTFIDVTDVAGDGPSVAAVSRGLAVGDLDSDGRLDYIVANNNQPAQVVLNRSTPVGRWVGLWLEGRTSNRNAIGAVVTAEIGPGRIVRQIHGGQSYLSVSDFRVHFGLGQAAAIDRLTILWPGGFEQVIEDIAADSWYRVVEGESVQPFTPGERAIAP